MRELGLAAYLAPVVTAADAAELASGDGEAEDAARSIITPKTVEEAEKMHAVHFGVAQRKELTTAIPMQLKAVTELRRVPRPLALQPGLHFDPRLPGEHFRQQENILRLASVHEMPLPRDDAAVAYAPVTHLANWIRTGQLTSVRLTEIYLERITHIAPRLYCYITVCADLRITM